MKKLILLIVATSLLPTLATAKRCSEFKTQAEAQAYFKKTADKRLDRDNDGAACDCLPGGNGKNCPKSKATR